MERTCLGKMGRVCLLLCLLLLIPTVSRGHGCKNPPGGDGDIRVIGVNCTEGAAGRIEICVGMKWRAVCGENWGQNDARVVCRQLGFQAQVLYTCRDSCFGQNTNLKGITNFVCQEQPDRLIECDHEEIADSCTAEAGVICNSISCLRTIIADSPGPQTCDCSDMTCPTSTPSPPTAPSATLPSIASTPPQSNSTPSCDCTDLPSNFTRATVLPGTSEEGQQTRTDSCTAIGGGLGALAVVLALTLVGVVLGWVWHCRKNNRKSSQSGTALANPSYETTSQPQDTIWYSSQGPQDTPPNTSPTAETPYDIIDSPEAGTSQEPVYNVLEHK